LDECRDQRQKYAEILPVFPWLIALHDGQKKGSLALLTP